MYYVVQCHECYGRDLVLHQKVALQNLIIPPLNVRHYLVHNIRGIVICISYYDRIQAEYGFYSRNILLMVNYKVVCRFDIYFIYWCMAISNKQRSICFKTRLLQTVVQHKILETVLIQLEILQSPMSKLALVGFWIKSVARTFVFPF
jgi:hypothetical protein